VKRLVVRTPLRWVEAREAFERGIALSPDYATAWSRPIEACIRDAQKAGEISRDGDPRVLAEFLLNSFEGAMLRMKVEKDGSPLDHFMTLIFSRVLT